MRFRDFGPHLFFPTPGDPPERYLHDLKRLEWVLAALRWLWVPVMFLMAWLHHSVAGLHHPASTTIILVLTTALGVCNAIACLLNARIRSAGAQHALGVAVLAVDALVAWGVISLFVRDPSTDSYALFIIIIEGAVRFGMVGSLVMALLFVVGLSGAFVYRDLAFGVPFSVSGYMFWSGLMAIVAVSLGAMVHEGRNQREQTARYLAEKALLTQRNRIARELHDTVLKTLQGLPLEARALRNRAKGAPPFVSETAHYIEEVCSHTSQEIREVIFDLRAEGPTEGIRSSISKMLVEWSKTTGIRSEFASSGQDVTFPPEPDRNIRNIVSEALTNIQRHAAASHVRVAVKTSPDVLDVEISDNGRGLSHSGDELHVYVIEGRLGIAGMKERAELLGGRFAARGDRNGTRVSFSVPLHRTQRDGQ